MEAPIKPPPKPRLVFQGSIEGYSIEYLMDEYNELRAFINSICPTYTLSAQIIQQIDPCCPEKKKGSDNAKNSESP